MPPADQVQVMMAKGIYSNWKQVIYFDYDAPVTADLLLEVVTHLENCGLVPVGAVCDLGPTNRALRKKLEITESKPFFHSNKGNPIFMFADPPHLLKLLRHHFLAGMQYSKDGIVKSITKDAVIQLLKKQITDKKLAHKLTWDHLDVAGLKAQNVLKAAQLMSMHVASAIRHLASTKKSMPENSMDTADYIETSNDSFDIFNVYAPKINSMPTKQGYGLQLEKQDLKLDKMADYMKHSLVGKHKTMVSCQEAMVVNISALKMMRKHLEDTANMPYLLTRRLNQDDLESFFGVLRGRDGGAYDHPTPLTKKYRIRAGILGMIEYII